MAYSVYIIYSRTLDRYYVGYTGDALSERVRKHNSSIKKGFTRTADDWRVVYSESFSTKTQAMTRERDIKAKKSRKYIEALVQSTPI